MEAPAIPNYMKAVRVIMAAAGKVQEVVQKPPGEVHNLANKQAITILFNDGFKREALIIKHYLDSINRGVVWADSAWKNSCHFFNPENHQGIWRWPNAVLECQLHFCSAVKQAKAGNHAKAMFYLGAAVHLVQDLCVPHHAKGILFDGHQEFEDWAEAHCHSYLIPEGGVYDVKDADPGRWVINNATISQQYYPLVSAGGPEQDYNLATNILLGWCQKTTAGFFAFFCQEYLKTN